MNHTFLNAQRDVKTSWHTCTAANSEGAFCDAHVPDDSPISMCERHLLVGFGYCQDLMAKATPEQRIAPDPRKLARNRLRPPVVYYAMVGDKIKVGVSTQLSVRMRQLGATLLATEPGDEKLEAQRHKQFAHLLARGREYFDPGHDLLAHVVKLQKKRRE